MFEKSRRFWNSENIFCLFFERSVSIKTKIDSANSGMRIVSIS